MVDANQMAGYLIRLVRESGKPVIARTVVTVGDKKLSETLELMPDDLAIPGLPEKKVQVWLNDLGFKCAAQGDKEQQHAAAKDTFAPQ